jgi:hypothetical protein
MPVTLHALQGARVDLLQLMINAESELELLKSKNEPVEDPGVDSLLPPAEAEENVQAWTSSHKGELMKWLCGFVGKQ